MLINSNLDIFTVLLSILVGTILSIIYDIFKSLRIVFKNNTVSVLIEDIIYSLIASFLVFMLLLVRVKGELRFFVFLFLLIGFCITKYTISKTNTKIISKSLKFLKNKILSPTIRLFNNISFKSNELIDIFFTKILKNNLKDKA